MIRLAYDYEPFKVKTEKKFRSHEGQISEYGNSATNAAIKGTAGAGIGAILGGAGKRGKGALIGLAAGSILGGYSGVRATERRAKLEPNEQTSPGKYFGRALGTTAGGLGGAALGSIAGGVLGSLTGSPRAAYRGMSAGGLLGGLAGAYYGDRFIRNS